MISTTIFQSGYMHLFEAQEDGGAGTVRLLSAGAHVMWYNISCATRESEVMQEVLNGEDILCDSNSSGQVAKESAAEATMTSAMHSNDLTNAAQRLRT